MFKLMFIGLILSVASFGATIDRLDKTKVESKTINELLPLADALHKLADKEVRFHERYLRVYSVVPDKGEKEWEAIRELVDKVNHFEDAEQGTGEEDATAFIVKKGVKFKDVAVGFVGELDESDRYSKELNDGIRSLRDRISALTKNVDHVAFYRIFSSNESQGHLGWVYYNRETQEALYVSFVNDY